ncbi:MULTISPECIES: hypothetical protein [Saccharibacillus]|uniref:hypothetical protein n=1 Tax=Saccharibacillus TaxID=456492 RepID=UPI00123889A1|nr:hypothetical protein [Saccharibacillus sp. WB 17]MWJ30798.1 hypothetical protein [Saccharibacillus sp. WB 17]
MADPNGFAMNAGELKATARYFDQIQRASDRLGRTRYQNIVKLNNELKFTARYFDQIYRTALKLSRLKLMPKVTLDDKASRDIDRLLEKLGQIRSKRIQVSADIQMPAVPAMPKVRQKVEALPRIAQAAPAAPKVPQRVEPLPPIATGASKIIKDKPIAPKPDPAAQKPSIVQQQQSLKLSIINPAPSFPPIDFQPLVTALTINTDALVQLTSKLGNLQVGAGGGEEEKPKKWWEKLRDAVDHTKSLAAAGKGGSELRGDYKALKDLRDTTIVGEGATQAERDQDRRNKMRDKRWKLSAGYFGLAEKGAGVLVDGIDGVSGLVGDAVDFFTKGGGDIGESLLGGVLKGGAKRALGPLSYAFDIANIAQATEGEERSKAVGSAVGGSIGSAIGGFAGSFIPIPVVGSMGGAALGGLAGEWAGDKVGSLIYNNQDWINNKLGEAKNVVSSVIGEENLKQIGETTVKVVDDIGNKFKSMGENVMNFFSGKKEEEKPATKPSAPLSPTLAQAAGIPSPAMYGPMRDPAPSRFADPMDPIAMMNQRLISQAAPKVLPPAVPPQPATPPAGIAGANAAGSGGQISVEMSQTQMGALSGMIQEAKTEVTNQVSINISPGTVQLDIHEEIDYAEIEGKIGAAIVAKVRQAFNNYKPTGGGSGGPSTAMAT